VAGKRKPRQIRVGATAHAPGGNGGGGRLVPVRADGLVKAGISGLRTPPPADALPRVRRAGRGRRKGAACKARQENNSSDSAMVALFQLIDTVITLYIWALIILAVLSWLVSFSIINTQNRFIFLVGDFLYRITEPALRPIRRFIPNLGGIDISPIVLILLLVFLRNLLAGFML
jgi:YggT family protein